MTKSKEELLKDEIKFGVRDRKLSKRQYEKMLQEQRDIYLVPREKMTFVIAHCIYNDEQFLAQVLEDDLRMNDVDIIHIMDGAWVGYPNGEGESTDGTIDIVLEFIDKMKNTGVQVVYESKDGAVDGGIWNNESEKRNAQLSAINDIIDDPYYILIKDGDEFFQINNGRPNMWLKRDMVEWTKDDHNVGIISTYAYYSDWAMHGARFLPPDVHYYTEKPMIIHDKDCNEIMNYNQDVMTVNNERCFKYSSLNLINHWNMREEERIYGKLKYLKQGNEHGICRFKESD